MSAGWLRAAAILLLLVAVALGWLAFTRFGGEAPAGSPEESWREQVGTARLSVVLGLAACFALAGAFACHAAAGRPPPQP